jgi:hypothetical protein
MTAPLLGRHTCINYYALCGTPYACCMHAGVRFAASRNTAKQRMVQACEAAQQLTTNSCKKNRASQLFSCKQHAICCILHKTAARSGLNVVSTSMPPKTHTPRHFTADHAETQQPESCSAQCRHHTSVVSFQQTPHVQPQGPDDGWQPLAPHNLTHHLNWVVARSGALT